jgi:hypothetical protein
MTTSADPLRREPRACKALLLLFRSAHCGPKMQKLRARRIAGTRLGAYTLGYKKQLFIVDQGET